MAGTGLRADGAGSLAAMGRAGAWVLAAEAQELDYGLRLHGMELPPAQGEPHLKQCLQALALYRPSSV